MASLSAHLWAAYLSQHLLGSDIRPRMLEEVEVSPQEEESSEEPLPTMNFNISFHFHPKRNPFKAPAQCSRTNLKCHQGQAQLPQPLTCLSSYTLCIYLYSHIFI